MVDLVLLGIIITLLLAVRVLLRMLTAQRRAARELRTAVKKTGKRFLG